MSKDKNLGQRIKLLRERAGMSQEKLAATLGMGRSTLSQIENDARRVCGRELVSIARLFNISVDNLLDLQKEPEVILRKPRAASKAKSSMRISVPQKNLEKFKEVFLYILNKVGSKPNIGQTVIYKFLYFIDFNFYEKYEEQFIGATYQKNHYGPTPIEFQKVVEDMIVHGEVEKIKSKYFDFPQTKYLPLRPPNLTKFMAHEIAVVDEVLNRLSEMNAQQISDYSHKDVPWLSAEEGGKIDYESVFYRTAEYSVRAYDADIQ